MRKEIIPFPGGKPGVVQFRRNNLTPSTLKTYRGIIQSYYSFLERKRVPEGIDSMKQWLASIRNPNTFNKNYQALKEYLLKRFENEPPQRRMELQEAFSQIKRKRPKKAITEIEYLDKLEIDKLVNEVPESLGLIISALFWTGCRVSELLALRIADCTVGDVVSIVVRNRKAGGEDLEVYLSKALYSRITGTFEGSFFLFEDEDQKPFTRQNITMQIKRAGRKVLGREIGAHTLRHSKAMYLKQERGLSPDQVAAALGHSSVVTTLKYYFHGKPSPEDQGIQ